MLFLLSSHAARLILVVPVSAALVVLVVASVGGAVMLEDRFIFFPDNEFHGSPADVGLEYRDITFTTSDGHRLHGWFIPGPRRVTMLWFHGNGGNISHRVDNIAMIHHRLGANVFIFDYRGYGQSPGKPSERGTCEDAQAALSYLRGMPEVAGHRIVLFGRSLGGAVAVDLAASEQVEGVILESTFTSIRSMARRAYPFLPLGPFLRTRYDSLAKIGRLSSPVLFVHSEDDEIVPYEEGVRLHEAAPEPKRFHSISGAGHNETYTSGGEAYWQALDDFLDSLG